MKQPNYTGDHGWFHELEDVMCSLPIGTAVCDMHDWSVHALRSCWGENKARSIHYTPITVETAHHLLENVGVRLNTYNKHLVIIARDEDEDVVTLVWSYDNRTAGLISIAIR